MESKHLLDIIRNPTADAAMRFIEATRAPGQPEFGIPRNDLAAIQMPEPLRRFYEFAGRWPGLYRQNRLLAPDELRHDGDKLVFYEENQVVFEWATDLEGEDPPVWFREPGADPNYGRWHAERAPLSAFLLQSLLLEFTFGLGATAGTSSGWSIPSEIVARIVDPLEPVPFGPLGGQYDSSTSWLFASDDLIVRVEMTGFAAEWWVTVAATCREAFEYLRPIIADGGEGLGIWIDD